jgi:DUF971 family protein
MRLQLPITLLPMTTIRPVNVTADRQKRQLLIQWDNGTECEYPFAGLRAICPCVECKGGHAHMGGPPDLQKLQTAQNESLNLENVQAVGSYALQFFWNDGHSTGIYTWDYLRQACGG